jgi:biopolymer transport protein ExbD
MKIETYARTAALFLTMVLLVGLYARHNPTVAAGHLVYVMNCERLVSDQQDLDRHDVVLQIMADGAIRLNLDVLDRITYPQQLAEMYATRTAKVVYVTADPDLGHQAYVSIISNIQNSIPELNIILIPPSQVHSVCAPPQLKIVR